ncbi:PE-PPE domain-containing protein [Mycolicibacterium sp. 050158]|uniref:PE-PPE domain-containing protein n=1 Tax=Mycolicibacterium sp. 050158 TaxID=3090602 RepID=UPI00299E36A2|nr:PE-PPE domain-containing protein [Mycolicibacterium sp. 050158]MDX1890423.1 PE-PPE domain-containing protein [Mycolicibacterium sp. 050158]
MTSIGNAGWGPVRRWLAVAVVAVLALLAAPGVVAVAQVRLGLNGARPSTWPFLVPYLAGQGLTQDGWLEFASRVGENWLPGTTPVAVSHPGQLGVVSGPGAMTTDESTALGRQYLHDAIMAQLQKGEPISVAALSEGTLVVDAELAYLARDPNAPPARDITFYVFGDMLRGLGQTYLRGITIPIFGQTFGPVPESQYDTIVVNEQWDGWANPPDRPWNALAILNAVMGALYTVNGANDHSQSALDSVSDAVKVSQVTNSRGGTTTTYVIPRDNLPMTRPLRQLGIPDWAVDDLDRLLMPLIAAGYSSMTPWLGPHVENGQWVWTNTAPAPVADPTPPVAASEVEPAAAVTTSTSPSAVARVGTQPAALTAIAPVASATPVASKNSEVAPAPAEVSSSVDSTPAPRDVVEAPTPSPSPEAKTPPTALKDAGGETKSTTAPAASEATDPTPPTAVAHDKPDTSESVKKPDDVKPADTKVGPGVQKSAESSQAKGSDGEGAAKSSTNGDAA